MNEERKEEMATKIFNSCMSYFGDYANNKINEEMEHLNLTENEKKDLSYELAEKVIGFLSDWKRI